MRTFAVLQCLLAAGFLGFWVMYFAEKSCRTPVESCTSLNDKPCVAKVVACERYLAFENSFPVPDLGYITPLLIVGALGLWKGRRYGILFSLMAGAALIFLGLLDVSFNLQNARYTIDIAEGLMNALINGVCLIFGPILVWRMWRQLS